MDWMRDHLWETWLIVSVGLVALELLSMDLIFLMLGGGALVGLVVAALGAPVALQVIAALVSAVALLGLIRPPFVRRLHAGPTLEIGPEALIGQRATVLRELTHDTPGLVKLAGEHWSALPYDEDDRIEQGASVDVVAIKGATAYVLRVHNLEP